MAGEILGYTFEIASEDTDINELLYRRRVCFDTWTQLIDAMSQCVAKEAELTNTKVISLIRFNSKIDCETNGYVMTHKLTALHNSLIAIAFPIYKDVV